MLFLNGNIFLRGNHYIKNGVSSRPDLTKLVFDRITASGCLTCAELVLLKNINCESLTTEDENKSEIIFSEAEEFIHTGKVKVRIHLFICHCFSVLIDNCVNFVGSSYSSLHPILEVPTSAFGGDVNVDACNVQFHEKWCISSTQSLSIFRAALP